MCSLITCSSLGQQGLRYFRDSEKSLSKITRELRDVHERFRSCYVRELWPRHTLQLSIPVFLGMLATDCRDIVQTLVFL